MLEGLSLRGFKGYGVTDTPIPIRGPLTVLIGKNGSGKTTVLQALDMLGGLVRGTLREYLDAQGWDYGDLPHLLADDRRFGMTVQLAGGLEWQIELETRRRPGIANEALSHGGNVVLAREGRTMWREAANGTRERVVQTLTSSWLSAIDPVEDAKRYPELARVAAWARGIRPYLFLDPLALRRSARADDDLGRSGERLAGFLGKLKRRDPDALARVASRVRKHYPTLRELDAKQGQYGWTNLYVSERWGKRTAKFNARQVSDGLLRLIAVSAMQELPAPPSLVLLDEVENGLHPSILRGLMQLLLDLTKSSGGKTQVVVTTHSVVALNFVERASDVLLVHRSPSGSARITPMSETRGYEKLRRHFDLGELYYNVGEERLLGGDG